MATPLTQSIMSSSLGGDYTSLASWEAQNTDLVGTDTNLMVIISGSWTEGETGGGVIVAGWTTDATRRIRIVATGSARHDGTRNLTSAYRLGASGNNKALIISYLSYVSLEGFQIYVNGANGFEYCLYFQQQVLTDALVDNVLMWHTGSLSGESNIGLYLRSENSSGGGGIARNCIYLNDSNGMATAGFQVYTHFGASNTHFILNNCLADGRTNNVNYGVSISGQQTTNVTVQNCIVQNAHTASYNTGSNGGFSTRSITNLSDDIHSAGSTPTINSTLTFENAAGFDYQLVAGDTDAINQGTEITGSWGENYDIAGNIRTVPWDIGPFFYASSEEPATNFYRQFSGGFFFP